MRYLAVCFMIFYLPMCLAETAARAVNCKGDAAAKLVSLQGQLSFDPEQTGQWQSAQLDQVLCEGSRIRVEAYSRASLLLPNGITLRLGEETIMSLNGIAPSQPTLLDVLQGFLHFISRTPKQLSITTPVANAGPEGTEFALRVGENSAALWVYEGAVRFFNTDGDIRLKPGEAAETLAGRAPQFVLGVKPEDAVNWALHYPLLLPAADETAKFGEVLTSAIKDYRRGRTDAALSALDAIPAQQFTPYLLKVRGAMRLSAGFTELAQQDLQAILSNVSSDSDALALKSILLLVQNRKQDSLNLAEKAVASNPNSAMAHSALSYAWQAHFKLEKALEFAEKATALMPSDALAWARLAEIQLSLDLKDLSQQSAMKAFQLDSDLEKTQTVMGFAHLSRLETDQALEKFAAAVQLDSTAPLARLGLGLAKIRNGDLEAGRQNMEIAAILDPNNSLVRSYLGKTYYEEKRSRLAGDQFELAKQRDPKDPTPYFYDAINKQTTNRPVEALHDMQQAIELNENRAVYRSALALDKDLAARSAAQGRIYNELGFQQRGLLEGWKSVNKDPDNYSAHRLLSDNYAALPRHEIARVSELLQSQLLQPVNIIPIQPHLADSELFILNGLGPSGLSHNEFNPLFEYDRLALQASGIYASNNTVGDHVTLSGVADRASFSLGQLHYETDGFRDNNFLRKDLYNAFFQGQITDRLNLQAEYRHHERRNGDLSLNFDLDNYCAACQEQRVIDSYRLGGRYEFSPHSSLIGSLIYQDVDIQQNSLDILDLFYFGVFEIPAKNALVRNGFISELQHRYSQSNFSSISGFGHIDQRIKERFTSLGVTSRSSYDVNRSNFYNYSTIALNKQFAATLGFSVDFFENAEYHNTPFNPKFGIEWSPWASTTFRAAVFRSLSVTRLTNQTIEPTQVAGFNQLFDDINGTVAWRYGAGLDHRFSKNTAAGLEYSERKLNIPGGLPGLDRSEQLGRAYFYLTPVDSLALSVEYFYERLDQPGREISFDNAMASGLFDVVETHRVPVSLAFFHPSGVGFKIKNSFIHQQGVFQNPNTMTRAFDVSNFFTVDLNLSYRLPNRHGMLVVGINNIFDDQIRYQNTNVNEVSLAPGRVLFSRINLAF